MFTVQNTSLDKVMKKYHVESTADLISEEKISEDDLLDLMKEAGTLGFYEIKKSSRKNMEDLKALEGPKYKFVRHMSVKRLILDNTVSVFMPIDFWRKEHKEKARQLDIFKRMDIASSGEETLSLMIEAGVGLRLAPGEKVDVNWTNEFVDEVIRKHPMMSKTIITKEGKTVDREIPEDLKPKTEEVDFNKLDYRAVQQMAKEKGLEYIGIAKNDLVKKLQDLAIKAKDK